MFKSKGAMFGVAAALIAGALLFSGLAIGTTTGAGTDVRVPGAGWSFGGDDVGTPDQPGNPPASPVENPTIPTDPNAGAPGAGNQTPGSLPSAGFGETAGSRTGMAIILLTLAGVAVLGAGAAAITGRRTA